MKKIILVVVVLALVALIGYFIYGYIQNASYRDPGLYHGNGRLEATEVSIASKLPGRIEKIFVKEGDYVKKGQLLALMQTNSLEAELAQAKARKMQSEAAKMEADASIELRNSELAAAQAVIQQKKSSFTGAEKRYARAVKLLKDSALSQQNFENDETFYLTSKAELASAQASGKKAVAAVNAAKAAAAGAAANIKAAEADIARIQSDLDDCRLIAPLDGRIQYRISEPGEVLPAGGKVLNLVDLTDVYMTFYVPEKVAGKIPIGTGVKLIMDARPDIPIPAEISFVSSVAQFTPKTVETQEERQKLMFRVKARIAPELLRKYIQHVKTGLPGVAWVKLDPTAPWPEFLQKR